MQRSMQRFLQQRCGAIPAAATVVVVLLLTTCTGAAAATPLAAVPQSSVQVPPIAASSGTTCAVCTIALAIVEQLADIHNKSAGDTLAFVCDILPEKIRPGCKTVVEYVAPSECRC